MDQPPLFLGKRCEWCGAELDRRKRADTKFCDRTCRQASWRFGVAGAAPASGRSMAFAYADPPYPGMAKRYYAAHPDYAGEVDHGALVAMLVADFPDGWALSTSSRSLRDVLALCPAGVRVGAWTKPAPPSRTAAPRRSWEPVIFCGGRPVATSGVTRHDWVHAAPMRAYPGAVVGTKPPAFCEWVFASLGAASGDGLVDLFPGSGAVARAWERYTSRAPGERVTRS